ncbi:unnamed protein product [Mesocestoides corti]|uniref:AN1-type domain-containing protein n=2 Tax=Mesocestoides corti TaxID=53468 RepID=A0A0R3U1J1_MESCO|nr:unnamed protein product [Mesocestoides corti]
MDLFIETLTGTAFELRVSPNDTVMSIKSKIQRVEGIPVGQQHLIWQNDELSDHQSLRDCSIPGGATLRLVLGMRGGPINAYRPPVAAAAAAIKFTPTIHFTASKLPHAASPTSQKKNNSGDSKNEEPSPTVPQLERGKEDDGESESQKHITFFIFNSGENLDLLRVVDGSHCDNSSNGHSTTSLLGPEESCEPPVASNGSSSSKKAMSTNLLSTSIAAQSLPFLQSDSSKLSREKLPQLASTTSEPSVLKAAESKKSSDRQPPSTASAATALLAGLLYATRGRDSSAFYSDTDECVSSDCGGGNGGTTYWLRPPSPEWDYRDFSSSPPPADDFRFLCGYDGEDDDDDSLADLEDYFLYYRSGDVLFGPPTARRNSAFLRGGFRRNACGEGESPRKTQSRLEERDSLAEKVKSIKAQLCQIKESRLQRRQKQQPDEVKKGEEKEASQPSDEPAKPKDVHPTLPPVATLHTPKIRSSWLNSQRFKKVPFISQYRRPYTTTSAVDLPTATATSDSSADTLRSCADSLLLPSKRFASLSNNSGTRPRGTAPAKTTSDTNLDAAVVIPGFSGGFSRSDLGSGGGLRQRRFGTVQPPDISKIVDSDRLSSLETKPTVVTERHFPPLFPPNPAVERERLLRPTTLTPASRFIGFVSTPQCDAEIIRGRSPTVRKASNEAPSGSSVPAADVVPLPPIPSSVRGRPASNLEASSRASVRSKDDDRQQQHHAVPSSPTKSRQDMSEPPRRSPRANRCASCNRKTGLANSYTCRCERNFCSRHRYAELHACPFDYKADARRYLRESNPVITAAKLPKI